MHSTIDAAIERALGLASSVDVWIMARAFDDAGMRFWCDSSILRAAQEGGVSVACVSPDGRVERFDQSQSGCARHPRWINP